MRSVAFNENQLVVVSGYSQARRNQNRSGVFFFCFIFASASTAYDLVKTG